MNTKKILYVITKSNWGGAQRYVFDLATELSNKGGFDVSVVLGGNGILKDRLGEKRIPVIGLVSLTRDVHVMNDIKVFFELLSIFKKERPDVIHLNSSKVGIIGALAGRLTGCRKIIFTAHGWAHTEDRPTYQRILIKSLHVLTVALSHTTIAVSGQTKKELYDVPFIQKKLVVVHNGVTTPDFYSRNEARQKIGGTILSDTALVLGTIAELHTNKGLPYAIEAFSRLIPHYKDFFFVIIGSGEEKESLHTLVRQKNLQEKIIFFESAEANHYLKAFDIFILPSIKEGLPYTILEAGCAKLPVVASCVGGIPEIIQHTANGLLTPPKDVGKIEQALLLLAANSAERISLGEKLFDTAQQNFSTQSMVEKTLAYYNENIIINT